MGAVEFECRFCDEGKMLGWRWMYDRDQEKWVKRMYEARLQVNPDMMFADLSGPSALPVLWWHGWSGWTDPAVGRILTMEFSGKEMVGSIRLDDDDVEKFIAGGIEALNYGINAGLSLGFDFLDNPGYKWDMRDGTYEKPDRLTYQRLQIREASLTPSPRNKNAGLLGKGKMIEGEDDAEIAEAE